VASTLHPQEQEKMDEKLSQLSSNNVLNIIRNLKAEQQQVVWFDYVLPSNGKCGYSKEIKLRELTTEDEKLLIKELFSNKENTYLNVIRKCTKVEDPNFDYELLTTFDQDFILLELSAITFPGEKDITIEDVKNHKITVKLVKEDLTLNKVPDNFDYPNKVALSHSNLVWKFNFLTLKKLKQINTLQKSFSDNVLSKLFVSIAQVTDSVETSTGTAIEVEGLYDYIKLLESLKPRDQKKIIDFYNENVADSYGYKLTKSYYCQECNEERQVELEPLAFFRIAL
jgi:hypothetical protein